MSDSTLNFFDGFDRIKKDDIEKLRKDLNSENTKLKSEAIQHIITKINLYNYNVELSKISSLASDGVLKFHDSNDFIEYFLLKHFDLISDSAMLLRDVILGDKPAELFYTGARKYIPRNLGEKILESNNRKYVEILLQVLEEHENERFS